MASDNEPAKLLLPYLQRADELQKHEPLVAYYCRLYAMERGLKIPQSERTKTTNSILVFLMNQLEKVDPNTGASMYESDDIIKYLVGKYGDGKVPLMLSLGLLTTLTAGLALNGRSGKMLIHM